MALTKVTNTGIADDAVTTDKIEDGTVLAADIAPGTVPATKLTSTLDLSSKSVTLASGEISNAELANSSITINGSSVSLGGTGSVKHIDWQAVTVADGSTTLNTTAGKGYFLDTNAGVIEVFLPSSPTRGDTVVLADYSGTFATNQIIINTGGANIDSTATGDVKVTTNNSIVELVYVDSAKGWLVKLNQAAGTTPSGVMNDAGGYDTPLPLLEATGGTVTLSGDGNYKIHTFTGDGCFTISSINPSSPSSVDYLVVAGGAGGGFAGARGAGGGGAGGFRESHSVPVSGCYTASPLATPTSLPVSATTYPITVGAGGPAPLAPPYFGGCGSNSVFSTITSTGGGGGAGEPAPQNGLSGGSGGGGGATGSGTFPGGTGNTPPTSPSQGNPGGSGTSNNTGDPSSGGGGGGAAAGGTNASLGSSGAGGAGAGTNINPVTGVSGPSCLQYYAGGGGGGGGNSFALGGIGGGGSGGAYLPPQGCVSAGTANTGGGGGGCSNNAGGEAGGKGIVVIRYRYY